MAGGTRASIAFDYVHKVACDEYDPASTNFYLFYFGDGELFGSDAGDCVSFVEEMIPIFNRIGITEIKPSTISNLRKAVEDNISHPNVKTAKLDNKKEIVDVIRKLFAKGANRSMGREEAMGA